MNKIVFMLLFGAIFSPLRAKAPAGDVWIKNEANEYLGVGAAGELMILGTTKPSDAPFLCEDGDTAETFALKSKVKNAYLTIPNLQALAQKGVTIASANISQLKFINDAVLNAKRPMLFYAEADGNGFKIKGVLAPQPYFLVTSSDKAIRTFTSDSLGRYTVPVTKINGSRFVFEMPSSTKKEINYDDVNAFLEECRPLGVNATSAEIFEGKINRIKDILVYRIQLANQLFHPVMLLQLFDPYLLQLASEFKNILDISIVQKQKVQKVFNTLDSLLLELYDAQEDLSFKKYILNRLRDLMEEVRNQADLPAESFAVSTKPLENLNQSASTPTLTAPAPTRNLNFDAI